MPGELPPHTCPTIDSCQEYIDEVGARIQALGINDISIAALLEVVHFRLEKVRTANKELRQAAEFWREQYTKLLDE